MTTRTSRSLTLAASMAVVLPVLAVLNPCYVGFNRSCGALHVDTSRVCRSGATAAPCGDVILIDANVL